MFQVRPSKISNETRYSTGDWQAGQQTIRSTVSAESRNFRMVAWNDSGVGKVVPPFGTRVRLHGSHRVKSSHKRGSVPPCNAHSHFDTLAAHDGVLGMKHSPHCGHCIVLKSKRRISPGRIE